MDLVSNRGYLLIVRMIQTVKEALHHHTDLDKVKIVASVQNMSRIDSKSISKRIFFNKELLCLGNLEFRTDDEIKISFSTQRMNA